MQSADVTSPAELIVDSAGVRVGVLDWGACGDGGRDDGGHQGTPLLLLHPNGFCAGLFDPLARRLAADGTFRPVGVDLRGHGASEKPSDLVSYGFELMARDAVAALDALGIDECVGLGQSLGGAVMVLMDRLRPGMFQRMLLCEAVAFPMERFIPTPNPMAAIARKRRAIWPDRATMRESYGARPPLNELAPEALDAYLRWGVVDRDDGQVELACPVESEAMIFEISPSPVGAIEAWDHLPSLRADVVVITGNSSNLPAIYFAQQAEQARGLHIPVEGGHFMVQSDTGRAVGWVEEYLSI